MSLKSKIMIENNLNEWDLGAEYTVTGQDGQKLFNEVSEDFKNAKYDIPDPYGLVQEDNSEESDLLQESAQSEFKKRTYETDWLDIDDCIADTHLKGKELYDYLMLLADAEMLYDRSEYGNYHDADKPQRGEVTPSEIKFNYKHLLEKAETDNFSLSKVTEDLINAPNQKEFQKIWIHNQVNLHKNYFQISSKEFVEKSKMDKKELFYCLNLLAKEGRLDTSTYGVYKKYEHFLF